ncbi:FAD-dependent monooxygenase [Saccharopolyspora erythraea]|uniref:FAD-dependent monooxygenase n=1 Tax=Saccharopolyspora erythraea TaxID=1836 RepID=UPI001BABF029|nr:FAD-dependent monooxygenase [Saccharopolyspora erythraea]QUH02565.1 FAD-dependent monooxygenase [Saccharopolyspora erythraea]
MNNGNVLISGAGVAGPSLAYWLHRSGFTVTVVERAPAPRGGGQAVDFRGPAHLGVLERMGVLDEIRRHRTRMGRQSVVDATGRRLVDLPAEFTGGDVEIERGELVRILHDATRGNAEYVFGDRVTSLEQTPGGVDVTFERAGPRTFDLVVGADGLHSGIRALAFGPDSRFLHYLGHCFASFTVPNHLGLRRTALGYCVPNRGAAIAATGDPDVARAILVFAAPDAGYDRYDLQQQKELLAETYGDVGWEVPRLLAALPDTTDLHFDSISRVDLDRYSTGRVVLLGDAGYGAALGGQGTGLAVVCAYVLATELAAARGDHRVAFERYERRIRGYATECQKGAARVGPFFAPPTRAAIWRRNQLYRVLSSRAGSGFFRWLGARAASAIELDRAAA